MDLSKLKVGMTVYRVYEMECSEGWDTETVFKDEVRSITESKTGNTISFKKGSAVYLNEKGKNQYHNDTIFKTKKEILNYVSSEMLK